MPRAAGTQNGDASPAHKAGGTTVALQRLQRGIAALREENRQLTLELAEARAAKPTPGTVAEFVLAADRKAPAAARTVLGYCLGPRVTRPVLADAQLLVTELITNSLLHGGLEEHDEIIVRIELDTQAVRLEVRNPGSIVSDGGDVERGSDLGLDLDIVALLGASWGVNPGDETCVWVEMDRG